MAYSSLELKALLVSNRELFEASLQGRRYIIFGFTPNARAEAVRFE